MNQFENKVAVITGAASGIGRALAMRCADEQMKVVLADVEVAALQRVEQELKTAGATVLAVVTDVSKETDIQTLAQKTLDSFGSVHLLFNNAGVGGGSTIWQSTLADWQWVMNVNLWGAIHATKIFVPTMLKQGTECHIVNTASLAGLDTGPGNRIYRVSKHALVCLSETLYHELKMIQSKIGVSVLCPGFVQTQICDAYRNRPAEYSKPGDIVEPSPMTTAIDQFIRSGVEQGISPKEVADHTFLAIKSNRFYILPDPSYKETVRQRMEDILNQHNPTFVIPSHI
ncbi:SDR family NAD(P)-dependent oxidoreductase [Brevibacillus sp. MER 51]|uniref:SDR family NAD(P)-dependent oxidoreductase n=1 Tax=Brevibacillus sp. MER 51 TaxID=2939560 RepID=UPI00203FD988|nr:SDR family NAD(P)-dependent oxidoreductase [Brevibacillus sp. MER 51]MCM3144730.1 SDR family NAD(P)-dependent oxidoreductase [Brevibacillus sp. MER 51]